MRMALVRGTACALLLALAGCATTPPQASLYDDLGGEHGIEQIVHGLIVNLAGNPRIRHHFESLHIAGFRDRLESHFCQVTGGPCSYDGRNMRESHRLLDISRADFNALVEDLIEAMDTLGIDQGTQNRFLARLAPMHGDIVTGSPGGRDSD